MIARQFSVGAASILCLGSLSGPAGAAVTIVGKQVGANVVLTLSGSLDLTGLVFNQNAAASNGVLQPSSANILFGPYAGGDGYRDSVVSGPLSFGTGVGAIADSFTGDLFTIDPQPGAGGERVVLPDGYTSNTPLSATMTFNSTTLSSLGVDTANGPYVWGLNNGETVTFVVPEPSQALLLGCGLFGLALRRNRVA